LVASLVKVVNSTTTESATTYTLAASTAFEGDLAKRTASSRNSKRELIDLEQRVLSSLLGITYKLV